MADLNIFQQYPDILTIAEMQKALSIGRTMAYRLINSGQIKHMRIGKTIKIPKRFLIDYISHECYNNPVETSYLPHQKEAI